MKLFHRRLARHSRAKIRFNLLFFRFSERRHIGKSFHAAIHPRATLAPVLHEPPGGTGIGGAHAAAAAGKHEAVRQGREVQGVRGQVLRGREGEATARADPQRVCGGDRGERRDRVIYREDHV